MNESGLSTFVESLSLFRQTDEDIHLQSTITNGQKALSQESLKLPTRGEICALLASLLTDTYIRTFDLRSLRHAIEYGQQAVDLTPEGNPDLAGRLNNLSNRLSTRYEREGELNDLIQAIQHSQQAVDLTPEGNPDRARYLNNLSNHLSTRYKREGELNDLTQAIQYSQQAVDLTPEGNPDLAGRLNNLSSHLSTRYEREGELNDLTQAIERSLEACKCLNSPLSLRLRGCQISVNLLSQDQRWYEAQKMVDYGLQLLPSTISHLSSKFDQENMMKSISGIAALGCAISLQCNNDGYSAIRVLESSRGAINRLAMSSKAIEDSQDLPSKKKLLETTANQNTVLLNTTKFRTDAILIHEGNHIQVLPLSQSIFQQSRIQYGQLKDRFGYDPHHGNTWFPANVDMQIFLKWLWDDIVGPTLHALNLRPLEILSDYNVPSNLTKTARLTLERRAERPRISDPNEVSIYKDVMEQHPMVVSSDRSARPSRARSKARIGIPSTIFPRIHWIGVGHMAAFPFHAAGYGSRDPEKNTMSCAISSYASTLAARAYAKAKPVTLESGDSNLLIVAMPKTPKQSDLPGVRREVESIEKIVQGHIAVRLREHPPVKVILDDLLLYKSAHFACHGLANPISPFQSGLLLCGNEPERDFWENTQNSLLTVETICSINTECSQVAFLSACCTAENASLILMDEGIHLAGGFQLAGFPHVIASLWEADDDLSVEIAKKFYQIVITESEVNGHDRIAYALHDATLAARRISHDPLAWATTIHFGP